MKKHELIFQAYKKYPYGTVYYHPKTKEKLISSGYLVFDGTGGIFDPNSLGFVYNKNKWAPTPNDVVFTTEDGVPLFHGDPFWMTNMEKTKIISHKHSDIFNVDSREGKNYELLALPFSTREAAEAAIEKAKKKVITKEYPTVTIHIEDHGFRAISKITEANIWFDQEDIDLIWRANQRLRREAFDKNK